MRVKWIARRLPRALAVPLLLAGVIVTLASVPASASTCPGWTGGGPPAIGGSDILWGTAVVSTCDVWVVGQQGQQSPVPLIEHWTGGSNWTVTPTPTFGANTVLKSVAAVSASDVWAVGFNDAQSLILHWNGSTWSQVPSPTLGGSTELSGVTAVSPTDAWAVGDDISTGVQDHNLILHWDGTAWTPATIPAGSTIGALHGVSAVSSSDAWAVGEAAVGASFQALALHWNGTAWSRVASTSPGGFSNLSSVSAASASDAWAVGFSTMGNGTTAGDLTQTLTMHWDGTAWRPVPSPGVSGDNNFLSGVTAIPGGTAWAAGEAATPPGSSTPALGALLLHWDGTSWTSPFDAIGPGASAALNSVAASSAGNVWTAGNFAEGDHIPQPLAFRVQGAPHFEIAVQEADSLLAETGVAIGLPGDALAMEPGTSPAVAANASAAFETAFTTSVSHTLFTIDSAGHLSDTGLTVAAGTSPAITALSNGGFEVVFTNAADGLLWEVGPDGSARMAASGLAVAAGTSPAVASDATGFEVAFHAAGSDDLWTVTTANAGHDTGQQMAPGTSPAIAAEDRTNNSFVDDFDVAYQAAASGQLRVVTPGDSGPPGNHVQDTGITMATGTSPSMALIEQGAIPIDVPDVLSLPDSDARAAITHAGLTVGRISQDTRCIDVAGTVLVQDPSAGIHTLLPGSPVSLTESTGTDANGHPCVFK